MQEKINEKDRKIEELQKALETLSLNNQIQKTPEPVENQLLTPEIKSAVAQEDLISLASNHEQNINFIDIRF